MTQFFPRSPKLTSLEAPDHFTDEGLIRGGLPPPGSYSQIRGTWQTRHQLWSKPLSFPPSRYLQALTPRRRGKREHSPETKLARIHAASPPPRGGLWKRTFLTVWRHRSWKTVTQALTSDGSTWDFSALSTVQKAIRVHQKPYFTFGTWVSPWAGNTRRCWAAAAKAPRLSQPPDHEGEQLTQPFCVSSNQCHEIVNTSL